MSTADEITAALEDLRRAHERLQRLSPEDPAGEQVRWWTRELRAIEADMARWLVHEGRPR